MDILSKILDSLHFQSSLYFTTSFYSPWSVEVPRYQNVARFHYVSHGLCWVRIEGEKEAQRLSSGDIIIIPHGACHILSDTEDRPAISLDDALANSHYAGDGVFQIGEGPSMYDTQLVCGHFEFSDSFKHPFVKHLPNYIIKHEAENTDFSWMQDVLNSLSHTATSKYDGSSAVIKRLSEVIFIQMIRVWTERNKPQKGFMAALNDPNLAKGLDAFHKNFSADWTVEKLANESNMSRSLFADKFKQYVDQSPMQYVTHWRMQSAKKILNESSMSLEHIAVEVGYESTAAFSKAFKRTFDCNPGEFRRQLNKL